MELPVTLVLDNNDFIEETLSVKGITHNTSDKFSRPWLLFRGNSTLSRQRTRSQSVHSPPVHLLTYRRGKRSGPQNALKVDLQQCKHRSAYTTAAFFLLKVHKAQVKFIPGLTGLRKC